MYRYWTAVALVVALVAGCEKKPVDEGSSNQTTAKTKSTESAQPAEVGSSSEATAQVKSSDAAPSAVEEQDTAEPTGLANADNNLTTSTAVAAKEDTTVDAGTDDQQLTPDQIKSQINEKLKAAMAARDVDQAIAVLEEGRTQLPDDKDISMALLRFQLQNDLQKKANGPDQEAVAADFLKTHALANEILGDDEITDPQLAQIRQLVDFNRIRAIALSGDVAETAAALAAAYDSGFEQYRGLDKDPFFAAIADQPEFQKVIDDNTNRLQAKYREAAREEFANAEDIDFDFDLPDLEGNSVKLSDFAGKVVIVDLWGTWCPPCRMEIPHFIELQDKFKDDLEVVGITYEQVQDEQAAIKQISEFVKAEGVNYPCVIGDEATQQSLEVRGFPTTLFIDREGKVRLKIVGYHPYEKLEGYVAELIGDGKPSS